MYIIFTVLYDFHSNPATNIHWKWNYFRRYFSHSTYSTVCSICSPKRDSPTSFSAFSFFHNSNLAGPLTNGLKYFRFWLSFRWVIRFLGSKKLTPRGIIPRGVKIYFCPRTFFKNEKCSSLIAENESIFIFVTLSL